ncbi:MAG: hypothetical protein ACFCU6_12360 [Balneolaceae bacterium]
MATGIFKIFNKADLKYGKTYTAPLLITGILVAAHLSFGILESYEKLAAAILASFAAELLLGKFITGKWRNLTSAYISGISVGILVRSPMIWPFILCSVLSIASKYVLRFKGTHIWNPSNFGIVALMIIAADSAAVLTVQWGNNMWAMFVIWIVGFFSLYKVKRFHICATYVISFLAFGFFRSWYTGDPYLSEIALITGPMYQLFVLFMITDPKTTVQSKRGQYLIAFLIAFVEMIFRLNEAVYAPFYALFIVGPAAMMIELWWKEKKEEKEIQKEPKKVSERVASQAELR